MTTTEMLRKSKLDIYGLGCPHDKFIECVERFAEHVRADEREACAQEVENYALGYAEPVWAFKLSSIIRARSNT